MNPNTTNTVAKNDVNVDEGGVVKAIGTPSGPSRSWRWVRVADLAETCSGTTPSRGTADFFGGNIPWIKTGELRDNLISSAEEHVTEKALRETSLKLLPRDTLLVAMYGQGQTRGRTGLLACEATINQACFAILPNATFDPSFMQLWFQSSYERLRAMTENRGGNQPNLNGDVLREELVPLPDLDEQRRIAGRLREQLAEVARSRAAVEAQLGAAQALPAALLRDVFDSPQTNDWPRCRIGDVSRLQSGYAFKSEWFSTEGIRLLRNANVSQGRICWDDTARIPRDRRSEFSSFELQEGDIILSLDRPFVGGGLKLARLAPEDVPALLLQRVGRFLLNSQVIPDYLYFFMQTNDFIQAITQHDQSLGVPHVSPKQVEAIEFPLPSVAKQGAIAARLTVELDQAARLRESLSAKLDTINRLPAALLAQAFQGGK